MTVYSPCVLMPKPRVDGRARETKIQEVIRGKRREDREVLANAVVK